MRTFEYRLYPNRAQRQQLMACLMESRAIYNEMLAALKAQYETDGTFPSKYDLTARFKGRGGESRACDDGANAGGSAQQGAQTLSPDERPGVARGLPPLQDAESLALASSCASMQRSRDVWLDDDGKHLHVPAKLGRLLKIKLHRPLEGTPVTAHLVLRADNHWYALIVCETTPQDAFGAGASRADASAGSCEHPAIGLDVGLKVFLADSEGGMVENPAPLSPRAETACPCATHRLSPHEGQSPPPQGQP